MILQSDPWVNYGRRRVRLHSLRLSHVFYTQILCHIFLFYVSRSAAIRSASEEPAKDLHRMRAYVHTEIDTELVTWE
jgi:hypothetical protein